jgi:hypothetical protein
MFYFVANNRKYCSKPRLNCNNGFWTNFIYKWQTRKTNTNTGWLMEKPEEKRSLGRPRHRWEDNIKIDLQEVGCEGMDWIGLAQERNRWQELMNAVINFRVP